MSTWAVATLTRIESDLAPYHDGHLIPFEVLETFPSLELVYYKLLLKECTALQLKNQKPDWDSQDLVLTPGGYPCS